MKNILLTMLVAALCLMSPFAQAQSIERNVLASAGAHGTGTGIQVDYTIGEALVQTYTSGSQILTQGFHQPAAGPVSIKEITAIADYQVFPNPFNDLVQLELSIPNTATVETRLTDLAGRTVQKNDAAEFAEGRHTLSLSTASLAPGSYILAATLTAPGKIPVSLSKKIQLIR